MDLKALVTEFADCVAAQSEAMAKADPNLGNKFAKRYISAFEQLRSRGDEGRDALAVLLGDGRSDVRVMAAAYLLRHMHDRARSVLEAEAKGKGPVAFGAAQALQRWKEGAWASIPNDVRSKRPGRWAASSTDLLPQGASQRRRMLYTVP